MSYYFGIRVGSNNNTSDDTHNLSHIYFVYFFTFCSVLYDVARWACTLLLSPYKFYLPKQYGLYIVHCFLQCFVSIFLNNFDAFETMYF